MSEYWSRKKKDTGSEFVIPYYSEVFGQGLNCLYHLVAEKAESLQLNYLGKLEYLPGDGVLNRSYHPTLAALGLLITGSFIQWNLLGKTIQVGLLFNFSRASSLGGQARSLPHYIRFFV